jgi:hypothetical protein
MGSLICLQRQIATERDSESESDEHETNPVLHNQYVLWKKTDPIIEPSHLVVGLAKHT